MTCQSLILALAVLNVQTLTAQNDFEFGTDSMNVRAEVAKMPSAKSSYTFNQEQIFYKGEKVWKWRQSDSIPETRLTALHLQVNDKVVQLNTPMIAGIVDVHLFQKANIVKGRKPTILNEISLSCSGSVSGKNWRLFLLCSDAGGGFGVLFSGSLGSRSVERQIFIEDKMVERKVFLLQ